MNLRPANVIGALLVMFFASRLFRKGPFREATGLTKALGPNAVSWLLATVVVGLDVADRGVAQWLRVGGGCLVLASVWAVVDVLWWKWVTARALR